MAFTYREKKRLLIFLGILLAIVLVLGIVLRFTRRSNLASPFSQRDFVGQFFLDGDYQVQGSDADASDAGQSNTATSEKDRSGTSHTAAAPTYVHHEWRQVLPAALLRLSYPNTQEPLLDREIKMFVHNLRNRFIYTYQDAGIKSDSDKAALALRYQVREMGQRIITVLFQIQERDYLSASQAQISYRAFYYDKAYGRMMGLNELIKEEGFKHLNELFITRYNNRHKNTQLEENGDWIQDAAFSFDAYKLSIFVQPSRLPSPEDAASMDLTYRSIQADLFFEIDDNDHFIYDPDFDPRNSQAQPVFMDSHGVFADQGASPIAKVKYFALTFNGAPEEGITDEILKLLDEYNAKASFFMLAQDLNDENATLLQRMAQGGHEIGSLGLNDRNLGELGIPQMQEAYRKADEIFQNYGILPSVTRALYAVNDPRILEGTLNRPYVLWSIDAGDSSDDASDHGIANHVLESIQAGDVILMQNNFITPYALKALLPLLRSEGYVCVTLHELYQIYHVPFDTSQIHYSVFQDDPDQYDQLLLDQYKNQGMDAKEAEQALKEFKSTLNSEAAEKEE